MSWFYNEEKIDILLHAVEKGMVRETIQLRSFKCHIGPMGSEAAAPDYDDSAWENLPGSLEWGSEREVTAWLRTSVTTPKTWSGDKVILHILPQDCEILAYVDGRRIQAFDGYHHELVVADIHSGETNYSIALDAYSGLPSTGESNPYFNSTASKTHRLAEAELWRVDRSAYDFYHDLAFLLAAFRVLDKNSRESAAIGAALTEAVDKLDLRRGERSQPFYDSIKLASVSLKTVLQERAGSFAPTLWAAGHAHIDTAWLWRLDHTRKKCIRTFSTVIELMKRYPDYKFSCSQPQQYVYVKEDAPELYADIKQAVKDGRWETVGGMWIEADCNVTSGESLVRQILYGQRFFKDEFGSRNDVVWLPDVFGYSAAFPQIIKKSGMKYFMTIKIYWSQVNKPPYQTFRWYGIDGTDVLTHFSPLGDYNALITPQQLQTTWNNYQQKQLNDSALCIYGYGDGGGGPTYQMLERAERCKDSFTTPKLNQSTAQDFFVDLDNQVSGKRELPSWNGELYLELHRGTYTTQGHNKQANRRSEILYQTAEQLSALSLVTVGGAYPADDFLHGWRLLLLNQFHDIIPGSSIREVYEDSAKDYREIFEAGDRMATTALGALSKLVTCPPGTVLAYNPLSWPRQDVAFVPAEYGIRGQEVVSLDGEPGTLISLADSLPSLTLTAIGGKSSLTKSELSASRTGLENKFFKIAFDQNGEIDSIVDKRLGREVIDSNSYCKGNALIAFEDRPMNWDAWDVDIYYQDKPYPLTQLDSISVIEEGPVRAGVEIRRTLDSGRSSTIRQRIFVYDELDRIDFETEIDWKESKTLLKVAFPVAINALRATYDIQFGSVERPTHWNTTWDWAKFEVCGQKWADLSEGDYGVSLLSDSKYGWDIRDNVMRLSLLRSPIHPDPTADIGLHRFTYSLFPHAGDWKTGGTVQRAYELNVPVKITAGSPAGSAAHPSLSLASIDSPNLIVETVKKAEDDDDIIVRLFDAYNQRGTAKLTFGSKVLSAKSVNLMEDAPDGEDPELHGNTLTFTYRPFEIKTFKLKIAP